MRKSPWICKDEKKAWIVLSKNGSEIYGEVVQVGKWFAYGANKSKIGIVNVKLSNISKRQKRYVFDLVVYQTAGEFYKPEKVYVIDRRYHHLGSGSKKLVSKVESWNLSNEYTLTAKIIDKSSDATLNNESTFEDAGILLVGELFDKEVWLILEKNASKISENIQWVYDSRVKGYIIKGLKIGDFYVKIYVDIDMEAFNFEVGSINPIWNNPIPESTEYAKQFDLYGLEAHQAYLSMKVSGVRPTDADYVYINGNKIGKLKDYVKDSSLQTIEIPFNASLLKGNNTLEIKAGNSSDFEFQDLKIVMRSLESTTAKTKKTPAFEISFAILALSILRYFAFNPKRR